MPKARPATDDAPRVRRVPISELVPDASNARTRDGRARGELASSLDRLGAARSVVIDRDGVVRAGNGTLEAAKAAGITEALVVEVDGRTLVAVKRPDWTDLQALEYAIADNRTSELAGWDPEMLAQSVEAIQELGGRAIGFDAAELQAALDGIAPVSQDPPPATGREVAVEEDVPEPPAQPTTRPGDVWTLGRHRLVCGDSCTREGMAKALDGQKADLVVTDPPYGVAYGSANAKAKIAGDLTQSLIPVSFGLLVEEATTPDARFYVFGGSTNLAMYVRLFDHHLRQQPRLIVWDKTRFVLRHVGYHARFELVYHGWKGKGGGPDHWYGDRKAQDLWQVAPPHVGGDEGRDHPTQKPIEVCTIPIANSAPPDGLVIDPFAGSGTTLVAAEMLGRRCVAIELDPGFCDVVVARWERLTGGKAVRV